MYPFAEGCFAPKNGWYVAAFANEVGEKLLPRTILNQPVVLYRKLDGEAVAVGGRCPHRHFPLGESTREGDQIVCGYHGISFGADGRCMRIPSQDKVPGSYAIPSYPLVEHGVWLFIWMGDADKADPGLLPPLEKIGFTIPRLKVRPIAFHEIACRYQLLNDNLLDLSHLSFLHSASSGGTQDAETPEELSQGEGVLRSRRHILDQPPPAFLAEFYSGIPSRVDRISGMDFYLPGFHAGISEIRHPQGGEEAAGKPIHQARIFHAVTPSTPGRTYYWFASGNPNDAITDIVRENVKQVIAEDIFASEEIEKMLQLLGEYPRELMIKTDEGAVRARRLLQQMMDAERA